MTVLAPERLAADPPIEPELLIKEARRRQRRRRLAVSLLAIAAVGSYLVTRTTAPAQRSGSLLSRPLHVPSLGPGGRCPVSSGEAVSSSFFVGDALGHGPVRVLLGDEGDILRGRVALSMPPASGWYGIQTLWFAMPRYDGPFVVRGARLGKRGPIEVQPGENGYDAGQVPGSGPLVVARGPTSNTFYTTWRAAHVRDAVTGRMVTVLTGGGYRTVPGSTWIRSPGCYAWQVDGRGFSETIVMDAVGPAR